MQRKQMAKLEAAAMAVTAQDVSKSSDRHIKKSLTMLRAAVTQAERGGKVAERTVAVLRRALAIYQAESDRRVIG